MDTAHTRGTVQRIVSGIGALLGWLAVILQLYLIIQNRTASVAETIIRFFSFYTILTNILVAICLTQLTFQRNTVKPGFFVRQQTLAATAVYITVVGLVYNLILRFLWQPEGLQWIVDELLHSVIPLLYVSYWIIYIPKNKLTWSDTFSWLIYPLVYIIYILSRGAVSDFYPYPFINVTELGYMQVVVNSGMLTLVFIVFSLIYIAIGKYKTRMAK